MWRGQRCPPRVRGGAEDVWSGLCVGCSVAFRLSAQCTLRTSAEPAPADGNELCVDALVIGIGIVVVIVIVGVPLNGQFGPLGTAIDGEPRGTVRIQEIEDAVHVCITTHIEEQISLNRRRCRLVARCKVNDDSNPMKGCLPPDGKVSGGFVFFLGDSHEDEIEGNADWLG